MTSHPSTDPSAERAETKAYRRLLVILAVALLLGIAGFELVERLLAPATATADGYQLDIRSEVPAFKLRVVETDRTPVSGELTFMARIEDEWDTAARNLCVVIDYSLRRGADTASFTLRDPSLVRRLLGRHRVRVWLGDPELSPFDATRFLTQHFEPAAEWETFGCDQRLGRFVHRRSEEWDLPESSELARLPWWNEAFGSARPEVEPASAPWTVQAIDGPEESGDRFLRIGAPAGADSGGDPLTGQLQTTANVRLLDLYDVPVRRERESLLFEVELLDRSLNGTTRLGLWIDNGGEQPFFVPESEPPTFRSADFRRRQVYYFPEDGEEIVGVSGGLILQGRGDVLVRQARLLRTPPWDEIRQRITVNGR